MPVKRLKNGRWQVRSYITGKPFKRTFKTKAAAERRAATAKRRSRRKRLRSKGIYRKKRRRQGRY